jgi:hypothetical protein
MHIRRSLPSRRPAGHAGVPCLAESHPEAIEAAPPPQPQPPALARPSRWSGKLMRRSISRNGESLAQMQNRVAYEATMRRIDSGGV